MIYEKATTLSVLLVFTLTGLSAIMHDLNIQVPEVVIGIMRGFLWLITGLIGLAALGGVVALLGLILRRVTLRQWVGTLIVFSGVGVMIVGMVNHLPLVIALGIGLLWAGFLMSPGDDSGDIRENP